MIPVLLNVLLEVSRFAHWVEPKLVGEVMRRNWTEDGRMRHPGWRGLGFDKDPSEVRRPWLTGEGRY
jgi:bifunctional non-homologous end joining protein LigD